MEIDIPETRRWKVVARVSRQTDTGWQTSVGIPLFFLGVDIQGIVNAEHAQEIARKVIDPFGLYSITVDVAPDAGD